MNYNHIKEITKKTIGQRLGDARRANKVKINDKGKEKSKPLTQQKLCDDINLMYPNRKPLTLSAYKSYENGNVEIPTDLVPILCHYLEIDYEYLYGQIDEFSKEKQLLNELTGLSPKVLEKLHEHKNQDKFYNENLYDRGTPYELMSDLIIDEDFWHIMQAFSMAKSSMGEQIILSSPLTTLIDGNDINNSYVIREPERQLYYLFTELIYKAIERVYKKDHEKSKN